MPGDSGFGFQSLYRAVSSTTGTTSSASLPSSSARDVSLQGLCTRATILGNNISVRLVELLTAVKNAPAGIHKLASEFLEISRILWFIEAGLAKADRRESHEPIHTSEEWEPSGEEVRASIFSPMMADVLDSRLRQTIRDFEALDNLLVKCFEAEKKGAVAKLQSRWRKLFAGRDLDRMRSSLASAREALRASTLVFQCSTQNKPADVSIGIGYNGLAAALDTSTKKRPGMRARAKTTDMQNLKKRNGPHSVRSSVEEAPTTLSDGGKSDTPAELSSANTSRTSSRAPPTDRASRVPPSRTVSDWPGSYGEANTRSLTPIRAISDGVESSWPNPTRTPDSSVSRGRSYKRRPSPSNPETSSSLSDAGTWMDEMTSLDVSSASEPLPKIEAHPETMPRWTARDDVGGNAEALKMTLVSALETQNHRVVEQVLDKGVSPDTTGPHLLRQAVLNYDTESLLLFLLFGADPNRADTDGVTPLYSAVHAEYTEGAKILLKYGADPNLRAAQGETPLDLAVSKGDCDLVQTLLIYGGDPNIYPPSGEIPLIEAISNTSPDNLVALLLDYGADPDATDNEGQTPLCKAVSADRADIVLCLLEHGADPNCPGPEHVLWRATYRPECLKLLLSRGADHRLAPGVLELATSINKPESARALLEAGVDANLRKNGIFSPLGTAIRNGRHELVKILLEGGADPNAQNPEYPLAACVVRGRNEILPLLVKGGAKVSRVPGILETAAGAGNVLAMAWLLQHGADPNERSAAGETPLTRSIRENLPEAVDILLSFGADADLKGRESPVEVAIKYPALLRKIVGRVDVRRYEGLVERAENEGQEESVRILREAGAM
ncbi:hypothetical protein VUR80DRAFT_3025 [Thermomyces stellatus]